VDERGWVYRAVRCQMKGWMGGKEGLYGGRWMVIFLLVLFSGFGDQFVWEDVVGLGEVGWR
jgi:hypothetical protein